MIGFLLKKSLFDGLESLINVIITNIGFLFFVVGLYFTMMAFDGFYWLEIIICLVILFGLSLYLLGVSGMNYGTSCYKKSGWITFIDSLKEYFCAGVFFFLCIAVIFISITIIIPFYFSAGGLIGGFFGMTAVWINVILILSLQYFFPLTMYVKNDDKSLKGSFYTLKKGFRIFANNIGFSLFVLLYSVLNLAVSVLFGFIIPGLSGINILHMNALRLMKQKYDRIEAKQVFDWNIVLKEDIEILGDKRILDILFPGRRSKKN